MQALYEYVNSRREDVLKSTLFLLVSWEEEGSVELVMFAFLYLTLCPGSMKGFFYQEPQGKVFDRGPAKSNLKLKHM